MISLQPLSAANRAAAEALRVAPGQERFVSSVADSLREAAEHPDAHPLCWVICDDDAGPVGFVMVADEVDRPEYLPHYLWKLLIDSRHQRQGFGTAALDLIAAWFRDRSGAETLTTSAHPGDGGPIPFYERYGFERTGELHGDEVVLALANAKTPPERGFRHGRYWARTRGRVVGARFFAGVRWSEVTSGAPAALKLAPILAPNHFSEAEAIVSCNNPALETVCVLDRR